MVQPAGVDDAENKIVGLTVQDGQRRIWVGRRDDGIASVSPMDAAGKRRIALEVAAPGEPSLMFFDATGEGGADPGAGKAGRGSDPGPIIPFG